TQESATARSTSTSPEMSSAPTGAAPPARVLLVGAGGLGSAAALVLAERARNAAPGLRAVGTLLIADGDRLEPSNLHRQVIHASDRVGVPKAASAARALATLAPAAIVVPVEGRLTAERAPSLLAGIDLVLDGSDNFATKFLINDACV